VETSPERVQGGAEEEERIPGGVDPGHGIERDRPGCTQRARAQDQELEDRPAHRRDRKRDTIRAGRPWDIGPGCGARGDRPDRDAAEPLARSRVPEGPAPGEVGRVREDGERQVEGNPQRVDRDDDEVIEQRLRLDAQAAGAVRVAVQRGEGGRRRRGSRAGG
jgi:hypothetical protein